MAEAVAIKDIDQTGLERSRREQGPALAELESAGREDVDALAGLRDVIRPRGHRLPGGAEVEMTSDALSFSPRARPRAWARARRVSTSTISRRYSSVPRMSVISLIGLPKRRSRSFVTAATSHSF